MKRKTVLLVTLLTLFVLLLAGCSSETNQPASQDQGTGAPQETAKKFDLVYATNPVGTGNYSIAAAQGTLVTGKTGTLNIIVQPAAAPEGIAAAMKQKQATIGIMSSSLLKKLYGEGAEQDIRSLMGGAVLPFSFVVKADSGIKTISDLKGKRVTFQGLASTYVTMATAMLKAYGLDPEKDVKPLKMSVSTAGFNDLVEGRTDAVIATVAGSKMEELNSKIKPLVLPIDEDKVNKVVELTGNYAVPAKLAFDMPGAPKGTILVGTLSQVSALTSMDEEAAYLFVKNVIEGYDELSKTTADLKEWVPEIAVRKEVYFPYHPGAVKYYKEAGLWNDEMEKWQNESLAKFSK